MPGARVRTIRGGRTRRPWIHGLLAAIGMAALTSCSDDPDEHRATEAPHTARLAGSGSAAVRAPQDNDPGRFLLVDSWTATYSVRRGREWTSPLQERTSSTESGRGTLTLSDPYGRSGSWSGTGTYSGTFEGAVTRSDTAHDGSVLTFTTRRLGAGTVDVSGRLSIDTVAGTYSVHFGQPLGIPGTFERSCDGFDVEWTDGVQEELVGAMVNPFLDFLCDERGATTMPGLGGGAVDQPLSASGRTLSGSATLPDGTDMAWTFVPEGELPWTPFVDHCPAPPPPDFRIAPAAESHTLTPVGEAGRLGMDGARQLADNLAPDRHVCSPALTAGTAARLQEIQHHAIGGNHDVANSLYDALFVERDAAPADWNKVRDLLGIAAGAGLVGLDEKPAVAAAARAVEEVAARELPDAGLEASLEIGAAAAFFGLVELAERAKEQAAAIAEAAFMHIHETFDPCESNADDVRDFLNALAAWMLLEDIPPHYTEEAGEYVERVSTRLRTGSDPECAPRIVLVPTDRMHHQWRES